jgi:hypothetical protein
LKIGDLGLFWGIKGITLGPSFFVECPGPDLKKKLFLCCRAGENKKKDQNIESLSEPRHAPLKNICLHEVQASDVAGQVYKHSRK